MNLRLKTILLPLKNLRLIKLLFLMMALLPQIGLFAQLSGTYTIGGTSPNYANFTAAVNALNASGVNGPVIFRVRQGTYNEQIAINNVAGTSASNTITFEPDPSNTTQVQLQYSSTSGLSNYVVRLDSTKHISFKKLLVRANGTTYSVGFRLRGRCDFVKIDSCHIIVNKSVTNNTEYRIGVIEEAGSYSISNNVTVSNCTIEGGAYGIYGRGYSSGSWLQRNWTIENNNVFDWIYNGINLFNYFDTVSIAGNRVVQRANWTGTSAIYGIYTSYCYQTDIIGNKVIVNSPRIYGIYLNGNAGTSTSRPKVANNMVSSLHLTTNNNVYGIYASYFTYNDIVFNSVSIKSGYAFGLYTVNATGAVVQNNAVSNTANNTSSYGIYYSGSITRSHNSYWCPNGSESNLSLPSTSFIHKPLFISDTNLHTSDIYLNAAGSPITGITTDFDGQTRNSTTPDIGADEFTPPPNDAGISEIANATICAGSTPIKVQLVNFGANTLSSVTINWTVKINTGSPVTQTPYSFSGSISSGNDSVITLGNYSFTSNNTYEIKAWTTAPNNSTDGSSINDTSSKTMTPSLGGIYTVGGTSPDYSTIQSAFTDLKNKGVCAPVTFRIRAGFYNESVMVDSALGMSATNTVTLTKDPTSTGRVWWTYSGVPLSFRYAHHFIVRDLHLITLSASPVVYFYQENSHIKLINNYIKGFYTSSSSQSYSAIYNPNTSTYTNNYITIDSNRIVGGSSSIHMAGYSTASPYRELGLQIRNNELDSSGYYGISLINQDSAEVIGNTLQEGNLYGTYYGFYSSNIYNFNIESNKFILANRSGCYGFYLNGGGGTTGFHSRMVNNYVQCNSGQYGIFMSQVGYFDFFYNTISLNGTVNNSYALYLSYGYAYLKNNNIAHLGEGYALYGINGTYLPLSDYNNIYSASASKFAYFNGAYRSNFSSYKSASSRDGNSVSVNPYFRTINEPTPNHGALNNAGNPISGISTDLYGLNRHATTPDMGCVEFTPSLNDAGISMIDSSSVCPGINPVMVRLSNYGNNTLSQARIQWNVKTNAGTPVAQTAYTWTGSLPSYTDTLISIGNFTFVGSNSYAITAYTDQANSTTDPVSANDTAKIIGLSPKMKGTYTVGGTSPDYSTLGNALSALGTNGICGSVLLNVRGGTYTGNMTVSGVPGASSTNTITVQTDPSSTSRAVFSNSYYPFNFTGASHYIFKNLTIRITGNNSVIYFNGSNNHLTFDNDSIIGTFVNSTSASYSLFYDLTGTSQIQKNLTIKNCKLIGGSYSIFLYGNGSTGTFAQSNIVIENNQMLDYYREGIRSYYSPELKISNNIIKDRGTTTGVYGIEVGYSDSSEVSNNDIEVNYGTGIYAGYCYGNTSTNGIRIFNNMVKFTDTVTTTNNYNGIYLTVCNYGLVAYNSVNMPKSNTGSYCLYTQSGSNNNILNNNFINHGNGYAQYIGTASGIAALNHNNLYSNGTNLGYYNGNRSTLAVWKGATSKSANSISVDPQYISYLNLHAQNSAIDGAGIPITGITTDIDGQTRNSSTPDIGADEFAIYANDAGISAINNSTICVGSNPVQVTLRNCGTNTLTSTSIQWAVNTNGGGYASQTPFSFTGSLGSGKDTVLTIGNFIFSSTGNYAIRANTSGFNSGTDQNSLNDTNSQGGLSPKLSGVYTVGSSTADDWSTIDSAITALETIGVCGPTTILIKPGSYNERVTFMTVPGASATNHVTILGDTTGSGVDWYFGSTPLTLSYLSHVTFRNLKIRTTGYTRTIWFAENNSYISFENNTLVGINYNNTSNSYAVVYNDAGSTRFQHHISFVENEIQYGSISFYWAGTTTSTREHNNRFIKNRLLSPYIYGFEVLYQDTIEFVGNYVRLKPNYAGQGIHTSYCYQFKINQNEVELPGGGHPLTVSSSYGTTTDSSEVINNFFSTAGTSQSFGMNISNSYRIKILHNSVQMLNTNASSRAFYGQSGTYTVKNNSFYNQGGGYAVYLINPNFYNGDYNNLFTTGSNLGYASGTRANLAAWRTGTGDDANSISVNPSYIDTFDLHTSSPLLNGAGTPLGVLVDFDGDTRSTTSPDIGADEFNSSARDLELTKMVTFPCSGTNPISIQIRNAGINTVTSASIKWSLAPNGGTPIAQTPFQFTGSLATSQDTIVTIGTANFVGSNFYNILIYVDSVNGNLDQNHLNDTIKRDSAYTALTGIYTVGGTSPDFSNITNVVTALEQRGVCGAVTFKVRPGIYTERIYLQDSVVGSNASNIITFETDTAFTGQAEIRNNQSVLYLIDARYMRFKNLYINQTSTQQAIEMLGRSIDVQFLNNKIQGPNVASTSTSYNTIEIIGSTGDTTREVHFIGNEILGGSNGIYLLTSSGMRMKKFVFKQNEIKGFCQYGMYIYQTDSLLIEENLIHQSRIGSFSVQGISMNQVFVFDINSNEIILGNNSSYNVMGLYLNYTDGYQGQPSKIYNNMISIMSGNTSQKAGIYLQTNEHVDVAHNSVSIYGVGGNNSPIFIASGNNHRLYNNNFSNKAIGWALYSNLNLTYSDYNNLYSLGSNIAYVVGNRTTLAALRSATGDESNSFAVTPGFVNDSNLHCSSAILNGAGTPLSWVTDDIDGQPRSSSAPDIGADEFNPAPRDAALYEVAELNCLGSNNFKVRIENVGSQTLTSAKINWWVKTNNGGYVPQAPATFTGSLSTGNSAIVSLGNYTLGASNSYSIQAVIDSVNNNTDLFLGNDSAKRIGIQPALSGVYSIGATGDFSSLGAADSALDQYGICGPVVFNIEQGLYNESVIIGGYEGASNLNTLTVQADSLNTGPVTWSHIGTPLVLSKAKFVTLRGLNLSTTGTNVAFIQDSCTTLNFENNHFLSPNTSSSSTSLSVILGSGNGLRNIKFSGNTIENGSNGIYLSGSSSRVLGVEFSDNSFINYNYAGIDVNSVDSLVVSKNDFLGVSNKGVYGVTIRYSNQFEVINNKVDHISHISSANFPRAALLLFQANGSSTSRSLVANNFFAAEGNTSNVVSISTCSYVDFVYNSVNVTDAGQVLNLVNGANNRYLNNSVVNQGTGRVIYVSGNNEYQTANNNNYYTQGTTLGYYKGSNYSNMSTWISGTSRDMNSVSGDPFFKSSSDLHSLGIVTHNLGSPFTGITTDIDGQPRSSSTPDIGADEYTASPNDAGLDSISQALFCTGSNNVLVQLTNYGTDTLKSARINWSISKDFGSPLPQTAFNWVGSLPTGQSAMINIGSIVLNGDTSYQISAYSSLPNNNTDGFVGNDSISNMSRKAAMSGTYVVAQSGVRDYSSILLAAQDLNTRGVCGPVKILVKSGTYNNSVTLNEIEGASSINRITIESDTANSSPALLSVNGYALQLIGADYVTVKGFDFRTSYYAAVSMTSGNTDVSIENNRIWSTFYSYNRTYHYNSAIDVYNISNTPNRNIHIRNNTINGGLNGIYYYNSGYASGGLIEGNHVSNFDEIGINVFRDSSMIIHNNSVFDSSFTKGSMGINFDNGGVTAIGNKVAMNSSYSGYGIRISNAGGTSNSTLVVYNNAISVIQNVNGNYSSTGLYLNNCSYLNLNYNSVSIDGGTNSISSAFYFNSGNNISLRNNSLVNLTNGFAIYSRSTSLITSSDYNNLYSSGNNLAYRLSSYSTLANWRSGTGFDANSTSANANYMSAYEMRPNHIALDGTAQTIVGIATDIDGVVRGSSPDIGAYQFTTRADDAGVVTLKSKQLCTGTQNVVVAMKNFGGDTLKSVNVHWAISRNGGAYIPQTTYSWNGVMPPGVVDSLVSLGSFNFIGGDYNIRTYTSLPNTATDELFTNDTLNDQLLIQLNGTYTLGDKSSDFKSWSSFANTINAAGMCGPVVIKARPKTYNESIRLSNISGISATNHLTLTSDTGMGMATLIDTVTVVDLNNMKFTTIHHLKIDADGSEPAIRISGTSHNITIDTNTIDGPASFGNIANESAIFIDGILTPKPYNIWVRSNEILNGSSGIYAASNSTTSRIGEMDFSDNTIENFYSNGIYVYGADTLKVKRNEISNSVGANTSGLAIHYSARFEVDANRIAISASAGGKGIELSRSTGQPSRKSYLVNNFVQVAGGNGFDVSNNSYVDVYHNSVHITPNSKSYAAGNAVRVFNNFQLSVLNNSFANMAGGLVYDRYDNFSSNRNNLYTTGQLLSWNNIQTLADWRSTTNEDAQSVSADPIYLSTTDLHASQTLMDSAALIIFAFNRDIDGDLRDPSRPDIGADEFDLIFNVGIVDVLKPESYRARKWTSTQFDTNEDIEIVVRNFGPAVTDIPVEFQFNGIISRDTIFGTLQAGQLDTFRFSSQAPLDTVGNYNLRVFTAMPNDQYIQNDTVNIEIVTLENDRIKLPFAEDFENVKDTSIFENHLGIWDLEEWDFETDGGRLQTKSGYSSTGDQAITMDRTPNGTVKINELILTLNLSRYDMTDSVYLDFDFIDHRDERHAGDSVWLRGSDTSNWVGIYDLWTNRRTNRVKEVRDLEVTSALASAGQQFSTSFQVRFGQEDNQRLPGDGRTFDNVELRAVLPFDLALEEPQVEYRQVPLDMSDNRYTARLVNKGYNTLNGSQLNVSANSATNNLNVGSLLRDHDSLVTLTHPLTSTIAGVYQATIFGSFTGTDKCPENDSATINFALTDTVLARDDNAVDSTFGFRGTSGEMGTVLEVFKTDTLTTVSFYLNVPNLGDTLRAHLYSFSNGSIGSKLVSTQELVVTSNASRWYTLPVKCMEVLNPGKYLVAVEQNSTNYLTLGITRNNYQAGASWLNTGSGWNAFEDSLSGYLFNIHANFGYYELPQIFAPSSICGSGVPVTLRSNMAGGKFIGPGITNDSIFNPTIAGFGSHLILYGLQNANGCYDSNGVTIIVDSIPTVTLSNQMAICENDGLVVLSGGQPLGGTYFGIGVSNGQFNPAAQGAGTRTVFYTYAKPVSGCSDTASATIRVKAKPNVTFGNVSDLCVNDSILTLTQGSPLGGTYSGPGVTGNQFDPVVAGLGNHSITYSFTDTNACADMANQTISVNDTPSVNLGLDKKVCPKEVVILDAGNAGSQYVWTNGSTNQTFKPTVTGNYAVTVTNANGCSNSDTVSITFEGECVGFGEFLGEQSKITYFPNPNNGLFTVRMSGTTQGSVELIIRNSQGQLVKQYNWEATGGELEESIDISNQATGVYFLEFNTQEGRAIHRVTVR